MATLRQMRQQVSRRLDQPLNATPDIPTEADGTSFWTLEEVTEWLDEAYRLMYSEIAEVEVYTLVTETEGTYTANARAVSLQTILGISDDPLKIVDVRDATSLSAGEHGTLYEFLPYQTLLQRIERYEGGLLRSRWTRPGWSWYGHNPMNIVLFPVPTAATTLRIMYVPAEPTALGESPDVPGNVPTAIPTAHHGLLVEYAVIKAYQKEENSPSTRDMMTNWFEKLQRFRESIEERQAQTSRSTFVADVSDYETGDRRGTYGW